MFHQLKALVWVDEVMIAIEHLDYIFIYLQYYSTLLFVGFGVDLEAAGALVSSPSSPSKVQSRPPQLRRGRAAQPSRLGPAGGALDGWSDWWSDGSFWLGDFDYMEVCSMFFSQNRTQTRWIWKGNL